jgi:hypothetical protein
MNISKLKVLESPAGFYVGRTYSDTSITRVIDGTPMEFPYDRISNYFPTESLANQQLVQQEEFEQECLDLQIINN